MGLGALQFAAFLSYSRKDRRLAHWLVRRLEGFEPPRESISELRAKSAPFATVRPVFRDEHDMPVGGAIPDRLAEVIDASASMIVLCTSASAQSDWVDKEIRVFAERHPDRRIIAVVAEGDPDKDECYPPALLARGKPLAADLRLPAERRQAVVKIAAAVLGVDVDQLVGRVRKRAVARRRWIATGASVAAGLVIGLGVVAGVMSVRAAQADDLARANVEKLLTDTRATLDEVGRLKAKAAVHEAAGAYFSGKAGQRLNNADLLLKWEWLRQAGVDALDAGETAKALDLRRQAHETTSELLRRDADNPEFLFAHGQSAFYLGEYYYRQNDLEAARPHWSEYLTSAERLFEVAPDYVNDALETDAVSEVAYARVNMGVLALEQHRNAKAAASLFASAIDALAPRAVTASHKQNLSRAHKQHVEALAQFAPASEVLEAIKPWETNLAELDELSKTRLDLNSELAIHWRTIAEIKKQAGLEQDAKRGWRRAREIVETALRLDPANKSWLQQAARLDASMGVQADCGKLPGENQFGDDVTAWNVETCLRTMRYGQADVCRPFADSFSPDSSSETMRPRDRLIREAAWARLLSACSRKAAASDLARLREIAAERFFFRGYHDLRIRTQLALSEFHSDDQWIGGLKQDLKDRGWKGSQDGR